MGREEGGRDRPGRRGCYGGGGGAEDRGGDGRQERIEERQANLFSAADPGGEAVEQDLGLFAGTGDSALGKADGLDGEIANEFGGKAIGCTPRREDESDGGMAAIWGRWTQEDLILRISRWVGGCQMGVVSEMCVEEFSGNRVEERSLVQPSVASVCPQSLVSPSRGRPRM